MAAASPSMFVPEGDLEDEDKLSITSTDHGDDDPEKEWVVEDLLAERANPDRPEEMQYLLSWEGFPMDQSTWEPEENLGEGLLPQWEETKREIAAGKRLPFDIEVYHRAIRERTERHMRRNAKRQRLGLPMTEPFPITPSFASPAPANTASANLASTDTTPFRRSPAAVHQADNSSSSDEAYEQDDIDPGRDGLSSSKSDRTIKQKMFRGLPSQSAQKGPGPARPALERRISMPSASTSAAKSPTLEAPQARRPGHSRRISTGTVTGYQGTARKPNTGGQSIGYQGTARKPGMEGQSSSSAVANKSSASASTSTGTATGYQGTARKPSTEGQSSSSTLANKSSASTARPKTPSGSSRPPGTTSAAPARSSVLANKFSGKRLTATRTRPQPAAQAPVAPRAGNVLVGGVQRKKRTNLGNAMNDPSRPPKHFQNMHIQHLAYKKAREKDDAAPSFSAIPSSFLLGQNEPGPKDKEKDTEKDKEPEPLVESPIELPVADATEPRSAMPAAPRKSSISYPSAATSPGDTTGPAPVPKRKKSVRFTEVIDDRQMDNASPESTAELASHSPETAASPSADAPALQADPTTQQTDREAAIQEAATAPRKLTLANYQGRTPTQAVARTAKFGPEDGEEVDVMFYGIARQGQAWLKAFLANDKVHFDTMCSSLDFLKHESSLVGERLCTGTIEARSKEQASLLANVAANLRQNSMGSHVVKPEYSILVYPADCAQWEGLKKESEKFREGAPLRYLLYSSPLDYRIHPPKTTPQLDGMTGTTPDAIVRTVAKDIYGLDFDKMLPQQMEFKRKQVFMLMIPTSELQLIEFMKLWLRSNQPNCQIFSLEYPGSWMKFHQKVASTPGIVGTIIVHCNISNLSLRMVRGIWNMLETHRYTFWNLDDGDEEVASWPFPGHYLEPGTLELTRLFPFGKAFFITPSFVLTDPSNLCKFLEWFKQHAHNPSYMIFGCHRFPRYLKDVTIEKEREANALRETFKNDPERLQKILVDQVRTEQDLEDTYRAWELVSEIIEIHGNERMPWDLQKVFWMNIFLDPNDEQSLVNHFFFIAQQRSYYFRKFYVLGSSTSKNKGAYRYIHIPRFHETNSADPDIDQARINKLMEAKEAEEDASLGIPPYQGPIGPRDMPLSKVSPRAPSRRFEGPYNNGMHTWIRRLNRLEIPNWSSIHVPTVSWLNDFMAAQFGDDRQMFDTFDNWMKAVPPFDKHLNTFFGMFYTIDEDWEPEEPDAEYYRHPWFAILRPVDPHLLWKGIKGVELFIWDTSIGEVSPLRRRSGLLEMQSRLIECVRKGIPKKNPAWHLDRVWVGNMTKHPTQGEQPLDITSLQLDEMYNDPRTWLPPWSKLLIKRGWRYVKREEWYRGLPLYERELDPIETEDSLQIPMAPGDEDKFEYQIFHPPEGHPKGGKRTTCFNHLYEVARHARLKDPSVEVIRYHYRPTVEWYKEQSAERRGCHQVCVASGEHIVRNLLSNKAADDTE
ncbi:hypothetical protein F4780DRAFT_765652 [Xylariomycetidae sp. FL0641]|nr:hypothetical protein F4780DRAFT_765652 [Xylariomycetidae sp. FL0641]